MHNQLLSDNERKIITRYLETGEKLEGFRTLLSRTKKGIAEESAILKDLKLIETFVAKTTVK